MFSEFDQREQEEFKLNRKIRLKTRERCCLYIDSIFGCKFSDLRLHKLLKEGSERLEKQMNIVKILKSLSTIRLFLKEKHLSPKDKFII